MDKKIEIYYMFRDLYLSRKDRDTLIDHNLRYDITIIPPAMLGCEYVKTAGHYHPNVPGTDVSYTELYEVLSGEGTYLLQRRQGEQDTELEDVIVVKASEGDKVLIPPGYGHITINASKHILKMANLVARDFQSDYEPIRKKSGGAYFLTTNGWIKNPTYGDVPPIRMCKPTNTSLAHLSKSREIYSLLKTPEALAYLTRPQEFSDLFEKLYP